MNDELEKLIKKEHFRVAVFGSARIKKNDKIYNQVYELAKMIGEKNFDIVTGGGKGLMEAASAGHKETSDKSAKTIGLTINLPKRFVQNIHLDIKKQFDRFSGRLDQFMVLSDVVVVMPGGIGTTLELFYTWQLTQVGQICPIPIILIGDMWNDLYKWVKEKMLKRDLVSENDLENIFLADSIDEAMKMINKAHGHFKEKGPDYCLNYKKYKLD